MNSRLPHKQFVTDEEGNCLGVILPMADYLLIEPLLRQHQQKPETEREQRRKKLQRAAEVMREEYAKDAELTAFTALDGEDFVE
ncbi:MAG: hypothetical protein ACRENG_26455 [bacterium]